MRHLVANTVLLCLIIFSREGLAITASGTGVVAVTVNTLPCTFPASKSIELGDHYINNSNYSEWVNFALKLTACPAGTNSVIVKFQGTPGSNPGFVYANAGTAKGVEVELGDRNGGGMGHGVLKMLNVSENKATALLRSRIVVSDRDNIYPKTVSAVITCEYSYR